MSLYNIIFTQQDLEFIIEALHNIPSSNFDSYINELYEELSNTIPDQKFNILNIFISKAFHFLEHSFHDFLTAVISPLEFWMHSELVDELDEILLNNKNINTRDVNIFLQNINQLFFEKQLNSAFNISVLNDVIPQVFYEGLDINNDDEILEFTKAFYNYSINVEKQLRIQ